MTKEELREEFEYILNKIDNEGLGYYLLDYTDSSEMPDEKSKELFEKANEALFAFKKYIEEKAEMTL